MTPMRKLLAAKERLIANGRDRLRDQAIANAAKQMALNGRNPASYAEDEREAIVAEEELKLIERLKKGSLVAIAVALGVH